MIGTCNLGSGEAEGWTHLLILLPYLVEFFTKVIPHKYLNTLNTFKIIRLVSFNLLGNGLDNVGKICFGVT